jgi:hypothetical protein
VRLEGRIWITRSRCGLQLSWAAAIILPSHSMSLKISPEVKQRIGGMLLSPMGDFSGTMTVRQLTDLITYLTSLEATK